MHPSLSIVIPVYNAGATLRRCLDGIFQSLEPGFECVVVDDGSTDDSLRIARAYDVKIVTSAHKGAAAGRNLGAKAASGDILVFIDADVVVYPDTMQKIRKEFETGEGIAAVFGSYDDQPGCANFLSQYKNLFHHHIHQTSSPEAGTFWTACGAILKERFWEVGGFDENVRMMEDIDLGYRLRNRGYQIRLRKDITVKHLKHYTFAGLLRSDFLDRAIPWTVLIFRRGGGESDLNLKWAHKLSAVVVLSMIACLVLIPASIWFFAGACLGISIFFMLNRRFYQFYVAKRGWIFALKVVPLHLLYYLYSTLGFALGYLVFLRDRSAENKVPA